VVRVLALGGTERLQKKKSVVWLQGKWPTFKNPILGSKCHSLSNLLLLSDDACDPIFK